MALALTLALPAAAQVRTSPCQSDPGGCVPQNSVRYLEVVRDAIQAQWLASAGVPEDAACTLELQQRPGGVVTSARAIEPCSLDAGGRDTLIAAVRRASPLPYQGYEQAFRSRMNVNLRAQPPEDRQEGRVKRLWRQLKER